MQMKFKNKKLTHIVHKIMEDYDLTVEEIKGNQRTKQVTEPRWVMWKLIRKNSGLSYGEIGRLFNKDHSTVMNGIKKAPQDIVDEYQKIFNEISFEETQDSHDLLPHSQRKAALMHLESMDRSLARLTDHVAVDENPYLLHIDRDTYNLLVELKNLLYHLLAPLSESPSYAYDQQYTDQHQNSKDSLSSDHEDLNIENDLGSHGVHRRKDDIH
tara:strand:- start:37 stop:675 length:639 start_codon:yes stop_codon:yes gene_type:complete